MHFVPRQAGLGFGPHDATASLHLGLDMMTVAYHE